MRSARPRAAVGRFGAVAGETDKRRAGLAVVRIPPCPNGPPTAGLESAPSCSAVRASSAFRGPPAPMLPNSMRYSWPRS